jgi:hypothetical protein
MGFMFRSGLAGHETDCNEHETECAGVNVIAPDVWRRPVLSEWLREER